VLGATADRRSHGDLAPPARSEFAPEQTSEYGASWDWLPGGVNNPLGLDTRTSSGGSADIGGGGSSVGRDGRLSYGRVAGARSP